MQLTIHVPDEMIEPVKDKLQGVTGMLEAVALDAVLGLLMKLDDGVPSADQK